MDYEWLYARLSPYYCANNGRPGTDPVVLIKMVLRQHLYGIPSLRQTYQRIQDTLSYRWFFGIQSTGRDPSFRNGKLCYLQAISSLDCGMFAKGTCERQFAYEAHTVLMF